jgi:hypothetical protein
MNDHSKTVKQLFIDETKKSLPSKREGRPEKLQQGRLQRE